MREKKNVSLVLPLPPYHFLRFIPPLSPSNCSYSKDYQHIQKQTHTPHWHTQTHTVYIEINNKTIIFFDTSIFTTFKQSPKKKKKKQAGKAKKRRTSRGKERQRERESKLNKIENGRREQLQWVKRGGKQKKSKIVTRIIQFRSAVLISLFYFLWNYKCVQTSKNEKQTKNDLVSEHSNN